VRTHLGVAIILVIAGALWIPAPVGSPSCLGHGYTAFADSDYMLPWPGCNSISISQGILQQPTHTQGSGMEYAVDFALPEGFQVVAARAGVVSHVQNGNTACGGWQLRNEANYVVIDHGDGTSALYLHLQSVAVTPGQTVRQGQVIGTSGKTGWTDTGTGCQPHLHFQVQRTGPSWISQSIPISFSEAPTASLKRSENLHSDNFSWGSVIETLYWETYRARISGSQRLDPGRRYLVTIAGTMSNWEASVWGTWTGTNASRICEGQAEKFPMVPSPGKMNGPVSADPEYLFAYPIYSLPGVGNTCRSGLNKIKDRIDLRFSVDDGASFVDVLPIDGTLAPDHSYQYFVIGKGHPLRLFLGDSYYEDNYGIFLVTIAPEQ
jgi:hypothetical protein